MMAGRRGRVAASLAVVMFAALALGAGLDRYARFVPPARAWVPEALEHQVLLAEATHTLALGDPASARRLAAAAVDAAPGDASGVAVLALAQALQPEGEGEAWFAAAELADRMSRHDYAPQALLFETAVAVGDFREAAARLDTILRVAPGDPRNQSYLGELEREPRARAELVARIADGGRWTESYLGAVTQDDTVLRARAGFLAAPGTRPLGCNAIAPMVRELGKRHYRGEADRLAERHCPRLIQRGAIADGGFAGYADGGQDAGWQRQGAGDVRLSPLGGGNPAVEIASRASVTRLVLTQPVALAAGAHIVRARVTGIDPDRLVATLGCGNPPRPAAVDGAMAAGGQRLVAEGCANEVLGLWIRPGEAALALDDVSLEPDR